MPDLFSQPGMESEEGSSHSPSGSDSASSISAGNSPSNTSQGVEGEKNTEVETLFAILEQLFDQQVVAMEDVEFPRWLRERQEVEDPSLLLAAAHLMALTRQGHVGTRIPLEEQQVPLFGHSRSLDLSAVQLDQIRRWKKGIKTSLENSSLVGSSDDATRLFIYDREYLYFQRYWSYEEQLARQLRALSEPMSGNTDKVFRIDEEKTAEWIRRLLPEKGEYEVENKGLKWQRLACWMALRRRLLVLSGGPGTGKTFTLVRLVALQKLLFEGEQGEANRDWNVALTAPTGKAAARINESVADSIDMLEDQLTDDFVERIPRQAQTIHRLLGYQKHKAGFMHNKDNPLPHDVVVVDEASMVDIALMTKLVEALKEEAQLILIGDKDQLASVEAGAVLGDICTPFMNGSSAGETDHAPNVVPVNTFSKELIDQAEETGVAAELTSRVDSSTSALLDCMVELTDSRRFRETPDIGKLAQLVNQNKPEEVVQHLRQAGDVAIELPEYLGEIRNRCEQWSYIDLPFKTTAADELFEAWRSWQILCAHRQGPRSARAVNQLIDRWMQPNKIDSYREDSGLYPGRPIIITENDYELNLFNGDIGIVVRDPEQEQALRIIFENVPSADTEQRYRFLSPVQLPQHESAWALTVHKSQGSEFDQVLLIMPEQSSPILTRELIYTALTRARRKFTVWSEANILKMAIKQQIQRTSALGERLWSPS